MADDKAAMMKRLDEELRDFREMRDAQGKKREADEQSRLASDPLYFFQQKIAGRYVMMNGKPIADDPSMRLKGKVQSVLNVDRLLLTDASWNDGAKTEGTIMVVTPCAGFLIEGDCCLIASAVPAGEYRLVSSGGAARTLKAYRSAELITYPDFLKLRESGFRFPGEQKPAAPRARP